MANSRQYYARSQAEVAGFFGVSIDSVKQWSRAGMPKAGKSGYNLGIVARWLRKDGPWKPRGSRRGQQVDDDPLLLVGAGDSPALERYRLARAEQAEWDLQEKKKHILSREQVNVGLLRFSSILRRAGERITKRFGVEAGRMIDEAIDDCQTVVNDEFGGNGHFTDGADS